MGLLWPEELVTSFLVSVADSYHSVFLRELVAPSIRGTVLVIGQPGDILQAGAGGNATLPAGNQHRLDADPSGLGCASERLISLPAVLCTSLG